MLLKRYLWFLTVWVLFTGSHSSAETPLSCPDLFVPRNIEPLFPKEISGNFYVIDKYTYSGVNQRIKDLNDKELFDTIDSYMIHEKSMEGRLAGLVDDAPFTLRDLLIEMNILIDQQTYLQDFETGIRSFLRKDFKPFSRQELKNYLTNALMIVLQSLRSSTKDTLNLKVSSGKISSLFRLEQFLYFREFLNRLRERPQKVFSVLGLEYPSDDTTLMSSFLNLERLFASEFQIDEIITQDQAKYLSEGELIRQGIGLVESAPEDMAEKAFLLINIRNRKVIGYIEYNVRGTDLEVVSMGMKDPEDKDKGYSLPLLRRALMLSNARTISGSFHDDNENTYLNALREGLTKNEAFKKTAFYKIAARLGFSRIIESGELATQWTNSGDPYQEVRFIVSRP